MNSKLAFVFPGQGSQQIGMLSDLAADYPSIQQTFDQASEVLGYDLWSLIQNGPEADLNSTDKTQPALLTTGVALWRLWHEQGGDTPAMVAGHSLGEYTALTCAGVFTLEEAVALVKIRGEFMQAAVPAGEGAMAAVLGLTDADIEGACEQAAQGDIVRAVNYNSPGQVVIAGQAAAVDRAIEICKEKGAKRALPLAVSVPSHCPLMQPAAEKLSTELDKLQFRDPAIPVIQNYTAAIPADSAELKQNMLEQLCNPVLWTQTIPLMADSGIETVVECGPGKVLSGLNKRIVRSFNVGSIGDSSGFAKMLEG